MAIWMPNTPGEKDTLVAWAEQRLKLSFRSQAFGIGVQRNNRLACVVVFHQLRGCSLEVSIASDDPRWATRATIQFLLSWPFNTFEIRRLTALIERKNRRSRKLCEGLGFRYEGTLLDAFESDDGCIYGMTRRWFEKSKWFVDWSVTERKAA